MPIDPVPVMANVTVRGWAADDGEGEGADGPLAFWVEWTSGYTEPLRVDFDSKQFSKEKWEGLAVLDFAVDFGPDQLDWEFCLDDLRVGFVLCEGSLCDEEEGEEEGKHKEHFEEAGWEDL